MGASMMKAIVLTTLIGVAAPAAAGGLRVVFTNLRTDRGAVLAELFAGEDGFPVDASRAVAQAACPIRGHEAICQFASLPRGSYALAAFHDENGNGVLDTNLLHIPKEGTAFSRDARGHLGPARYRDASFDFTGEPLELRIRVVY